MNSSTCHLKPFYPPALAVSSTINYPAGDVINIYNTSHVILLAHEQNGFTMAHHPRVNKTNNTKIYMEKKLYR